MKLHGLRRAKRARLEIIPMIDVMFFLLVFYMLSSLSLTRGRGLRLNLPRASSGQSLPSDNARIVLSVSRAGRYFVDDRAVTPSSLATVLSSESQRIAARARIAPLDVLVVINADGDAVHRRVTFALEAARSVGLNQFAIASRPDAPRANPAP